MEIPSPSMSYQPYLLFFFRHSPFVFSPLVHLVQTGKITGGEGMDWHARTHSLPVRARENRRDLKTHRFIAYASFVATGAEFPLFSRGIIFTRRVIDFGKLLLSITHFTRRRFSFIYTPSLYHLSLPCVFSSIEAKFRKTRSTFFINRRVCIRRYTCNLVFENPTDVILTKRNSD